MEDFVLAVNSLGNRKGRKGHDVQEKERCEFPKQVWELFTIRHEEVEDLFKETVWVIHARLRNMERHKRNLQDLILRDLLELDAASFYCIPQSR